MSQDTKVVEAMNPTNCNSSYKLQTFLVCGEGLALVVAVCRELPAAESAEGVTSWPAVAPYRLGEALRLGWPALSPPHTPVTETRSCALPRAPGTFHA